MFHDFINLLYPASCHICQTELVKNEHILCTSCLHDLPVTRYHLDNDNPVKKIFQGRVKIDKATALLHFRKKSGVQQLIHDLKYRGHQEIGKYLGTWLGEELSAIDDYRKIDLVLPVPLHKSRLKERGYNQVEAFGIEIANKLDAQYRSDLLLKVNAMQTQTKKGRISRWGKIEQTLQIHKPDELKGKNVLLVDDLVTTGATLEACAHKLLEIENINISIATMAITH